jgi:glucosamine kinase
MSDPAIDDRAQVLLAADVGRTTCRLARFDHGSRTRSASSPSGWSLADPGGAAGIADRIVQTAEPLLDDGLRPAAIGVGATGAAQDPAATQELAATLQRRFPDAEVAITSDVVAAHVGALAGDPGVLTIAGTGAVALAVAPSGEIRLVDGAGWLLGDAGGGLHIGRAGLAAAVRWHDGRPDGSEPLATAARDRFGPLDQLPARVQGDPQPARLLAGFAPAVADAARAGDEVACSIFAAAADELAATTLTACAAVGEPDPLRVSFAGGLFELDDLVASPVTAMVLRARPRAEIRRPAGDAIDGVHRLVTEGSGPHQQLVQRLPAVSRATRSAVDRQRQTVPAHPRS